MNKQITIFNITRLQDFIIFALTSKKMNKVIPDIIDDVIIWGIISK